MTRRSVTGAVSVAAILLVGVALTADAQPFGRRGGGGGFNRTGPAGLGGFAGRTGADPANTAARQTGATERTEARQAGATERTETRQDGRTQRTETRADTATELADEWDDNHWVGDWGTAAVVGAGVAVGVAAGTAAAATPTTTYITVLPCTPTVIVAGGNTYYQCGNAWYGRTYVNSEVVYVVVPPPSGN